MSKPKKNLPAYCKILAWLERADAALALAMADTCVESYLYMDKRTGGVTFLYPSDELKKKILHYQNEDYKPTKKDMEDVHNILKSMILSDSFITTSDFKSKVVFNALGYKFDTTVKGNEVLLGKEGCRIVKHPDFVATDKVADSISVWKIIDKEPPMSGEEYKPPRRNFDKTNDINNKITQRNARKNKKVKGGGEHNGRRLNFCNYICKEYKKCLRANIKSNPFIEPVAALLNYLDKTESNKEHYMKALAVLDTEPMVSFYLLFEPHTGNESHYIIPEDILFGPGGWNCAVSCPDSVESYKKFLKEASSMCSNQAQSSIDNFRNTLSANADLHRDVSRKYDELETLCPARHYSNLKCKAQWQDEIRFMIHYELEYIHSINDEKLIVYDKLLARLSRMAGEDYEKELKMGKDPMCSVDGGGSMIKELYKFVMSTDFLHLPRTTDDCKSQGVWSLNSDVLFDVEAKSAKRLDTYTSTTLSYGLTDNTKTTMELLLKSNPDFANKPFSEVVRLINE